MKCHQLGHLPVCGFLPSGEGWSRRLCANQWAIRAVAIIGLGPPETAETRSRQGQLQRRNKQAIHRTGPLINVEHCNRSQDRTSSQAIISHKQLTRHLQSAVNSNLKRRKHLSQAILRLARLARPSASSSSTAPDDDHPNNFHPKPHIFSKKAKFRDGS